MKKKEDPDFFELEPQEIAGWKQPWRTIAVQRKRNMRPIAGIAAALLALGAIVLLVALLWPSSNATVPDLIGKDLTSAMKSARDSGFHPEVAGWVVSLKHSDGTIVKQDPAGGKVAAKGSKVLFTVSKGSGGEQDADAGADQSASGATGSAPGGSIAGKKVCIDPGGQEGGIKTPDWTDPGMITKQFQNSGTYMGVVTRTVEQSLNLDIGLKLKGLLEKEGIEVVMTRESGQVDINNMTRAEIANNADADLLVSVQCNNSDDPNVRGTTTLFPANTRWTQGFYEKSKTAAIYVQQEVVKSCGSPDLGTSAQDGVSLFNWSKVPVVIDKAACLSNAQDDRLLAQNDFRWKVAWGLRNGIIKYLNNP